MSLTKLKQSLISITALKRTTSAMRVLSMSLHSIARKKVFFYQTLLQQFYKNLSLKTSIIENNDKQNNAHNLVVIIGSQRGLCGKYNHKIKRYFLDHIAKNSSLRNNYLIIGKQLVTTMGTSVHDYNMTVIPTFSLQSIHACYAMIIKHSINCDNLIFYYTDSKNLFTNTVTTQTIVLNNHHNTNVLPKEYSTGHFSLEETFNTIQTFSNACTIKSILAKAIESEQSIRFLSMDKAFKNSSEIIIQKKLLYNKLRHEKINKQLLEIIGCTL